MATENLKVKITADASQAKAEIGKFKSSLKETISASESAAGAVGKLKVALAGLAALKVAKAMISNAVAVAAQGDAIKDNAQKVFMGTTAYQEWGYVLQQNGVEMGTLKVGMRQFAQQVAAGTPALAKYGITAQDVDTAFQQAVATIQNMNSETEKIAAATELFGSRALELMPVLNLTNAETQSLMNTYRAIGGTMSNELIAASDVCTDSITEMRAAWGGLRNVLAAYVIPIVTKVVQWITVAIAKIRILLAAIFGIKETFGGGGKKSIPATTGRVAVNTGNIGKNLKKATKHAKELKRTLMGIDELSRLAEQATSAAASPSGGGGGGGGGVDVGDIAGATDSLFSSETLEKIEKFRKKIEDVKGLLNGFYLILKGLVEIALGDWAKGWEDIKAGIAKVWDYLKTNFPFLEKVETAFKKIKETWEKFKSNPKEFIAELKDKVTEKLNKLKKWWDEKKAKAKEFLTEFKDKVTDKWNKLKKWWDGKKAQAKEFATEFVEKVKDKWDKLKKWWDGKKASAKEFKAEFLNKVKDKWDKFKKWWDNIKGGNKEYTVKFGFVDKLKSAWNGLADKINGARAKSTVAAKLLPAIPKLLAKGGILDAPTLAVMGEYPGARSNPEIATPQSLMYETMQKANGDLVSAFASMTRQVIAAIENKDLDVRIGDEQIARSAQRGNLAYRNRTGKALI